MKDDTKLVATRISPEAFETLQIALLAEEAESMQELLRPVIEEYARSVAGEPEVQAINTSLQTYRDRKRGVKRLPKSRRSTRSGPSQPEKSAGDDAT
jgi:hypothetical protein